MREITKYPSNVEFEGNSTFEGLYKSSKQTLIDSREEFEQDDQGIFVLVLLFFLPGKNPRCKDLKTILE